MSSFTPVTDLNAMSGTTFGRTTTATSTHVTTPSPTDQQDARGAGVMATAAVESAQVNGQRDAVCHLCHRILVTYKVAAFVGKWGNLDPSWNSMSKMCGKSWKGEIAEMYTVGVCVWCVTVRYIDRLWTICCCVPMSDISAQQHLRSATRRLVVIPRCSLNTLSTGLLCGRPFALELSTRQLERSGSWQGQLQTSAEDTFIYPVLRDVSGRYAQQIDLLTYLLEFLK